MVRDSEATRARNSSRASLLNRHSTAPAASDSVITASEYVPVMVAHRMCAVDGSARSAAIRPVPSMPGIR